LPKHSKDYEAVVVAHLGSQIAESRREIILIAGLDVSMSRRSDALQQVTEARERGALGFLVGLSDGVVVLQIGSFGS
jgi:hypothetical protein